MNNNIELRNKSDSVSMASATLDYNKSFINEEIIEWIDGLLLGDGGINFSKDTFKGGRIYRIFK